MKLNYVQDGFFVAELSVTGDLFAAKLSTWWCLYS